jgi:hypothetical protein
VAEFAFDCLDVSPQRYAVSPTLLFKLRIAELTGSPIHAMVLRAQIRIEPQRRRYDGEDLELLTYLFGDPSRWGETLKPMQLTTVSIVVTGFTGSTEVDVPVACSYDLDVAAGKYFHSLREGVVPLLLLFSGTVFGLGDKGFWVEQVPWHHEAAYRMPVAVWWALMDTYFPNSAWLRLPRETVDALQKYKASRAIPTWDAALGDLLQHAREGGP